MMESTIDPRIEGLVILPCMNHILNMALRNSIEGNEKFSAHIKSTKVFQGNMRKNVAIRQYGKVCADFPETHWMNVCRALNWILTERNESMPFILQCIENRNEAGKLLWGLNSPTDFQSGLNHYRNHCRFLNS
jgi:hypothetical protein